MLSLGHGGDPTSPSSTLRGPAIACHASLCSWLLLSRSSAGPRTASATAKQPHDGATGVTVASALPPCPHARDASGASGAAGQPGTGSKAAAPQPAELPSPCGRNTEQSVLPSAEKCTSLIWGTESLLRQKGLLGFLFPARQDARQLIKFLRRQFGSSNAVTTAFRVPSEGVIKGHSETLLCVPGHQRDAGAPAAAAVLTCLPLNQPSAAAARTSLPPRTHRRRFGMIIAVVI